MNKLNITRKKVLSVLAQNPDKYFGERDLQNSCKINRNHISLAVEYFWNNDYVAIDGEGKICITGDGMSLYYDNI